MNHYTNSASVPNAQTSPAANERLQQDLHATLGARQELGPRYEAELIESFLQRLDHSIDARIEQRFGSRGGAAGPQPATPPDRQPMTAEEHFRRKQGSNPTAPLAASLGISIPLIAIAGGLAGLPGILGVLVLVGFLNVYYDQQHR